MRSACTLTLALLASCAGQEDARLVFPRPTEGSGFQDEREQEAEESEEHTEQRKAWFEHRHQSDPRDDWRALERVNGEAQIQKRNDIGRLGLVTASRWVERGSQNIAGRVHTAVRAPDGQSLYVGTSLGGVWQGTLDGADWAPLGDNLYGGAHHLAVVAGATSSAPDVVLVATESGQVHVTRDAGASWQVPTGLANATGIRRVLTASGGSENVFVLRARNGGYKLFRSSDRLATFQEVLDLATFAGDVWIARDGSAGLYAMTRTGVRVSTDLGATWSSVGSAPTTGFQAELTGSEAGAPRLWTVWNSAGQEQLFRSDDAGATWTFLSNLSDYWNVLNASIVSEDVLLYGGVETHRSYDAGGSFAVINTWGAYYGNPGSRLHADIQGIDVVAGGVFGETWYISTDGGLYRSADILSSVQNLSLSGLRISQYYSTHTSLVNPNHVVAGAQDQGYQRANAAPPPTGSSLAFSQLISGDYGHLTSGDGDHDFLFSVYPGFVLIQVGENNPSLFTEDFPSGEDHAWMPPVVADPLDARHFFLCASHLYRYTKGAGNNWTSAQWSSFDFGLAAGEYLSALSFSPLDPQRAYAVTDRGRLYHSSDHGLSWTASVSSAPGGQYFYGSALLASTVSVDTVYVGGSGYSGPAVYRSTDGGATFQAWSTGLPPTLVYCLGEAHDGSGKVFAGTETAAHARAPLDAGWSDITGTQAPITVYWSVETLPNENTLRFGTYGRGIWDYQLDLQARATVRNGSGANPSCLTSISPPRLGASWSVRIDPTLVPFTQVSQLVVRDAPASGTLLSYGEALIGGIKLFSASQPAQAAGNVFSFPVPNDVNLVGVAAFSQAVLVGPGIQLCNALDVVVGY